MVKKSKIKFNKALTKKYCNYCGHDRAIARPRGIFCSRCKRELD